MIQFNLLPDVKLEYIKARRTKHLVMLVSFLVTGISVGLVVVLFIGVNVLQKGHLDRLNTDIQAKTEQLQEEQEIDKILTVQNQLNSLDGLHDGKPAANRLGPFLTQLTPNEVSIAEITVDFTANTMNISGSSNAVKSVNEFVDTLKFTQYKAEADGETTEANAFSSVVLASIERSDKDGQDASTEFEITLNFDPAIFDITKSVKLAIPDDKITTRSVTERPKPLFEGNSGEEQ